MLLTPGCNFPEAVAARAAIQIEPTAADTERGLREVISMSAAQRREMGALGRALVQSEYGWDRIAERMIELYQWLAGKAAQPSFVENA